MEARPSSTCTFSSRYKQNIDDYFPDAKGKNMDELLKELDGIVKSHEVVTNWLAKVEASKL